MKRKNCFKTLALLFVMVVAGATAARGQVFILTDEEHDGNNRLPVGSGQAIIPTQNITTDQYAPLGGSIGLLCGLGLAYAFLRKKED